MKSQEIRDSFIKNIYKPLLKSNGYKTLGNSWWKDTNDGYILIHIQSSRYVLFGECRFWIIITYQENNNLHGHLKNEYMYTHQTLRQFHFLPNQGYFPEAVGRPEYHITDKTDIKELESIIRNDLEKYILPSLKTIDTKNKWDELYNKITTDEQENFKKYYPEIANLIK